MGPFATMDHAGPAGASNSKDVREIEGAPDALATHEAPAVRDPTAAPAGAALYHPPSALPPGSLRLMTSRSDGIRALFCCPRRDG